MNAPTLIVGLGGKGSDVALRVSQMVSEEERRRIGFAVFDTDVNELRKIKEKNSFVHTIQTSTKLSVGEYLDIDTHARDTWFPVNAILNSKTLTEGAGQVRAVSRMAFETAIRAGKMEELHQAIESLYKLEGDEYQQARQFPGGRYRFRADPAGGAVYQELPGHPLPPERQHHPRLFPSAGGVLRGDPRTGGAQQPEEQRLRHPAGAGCVHDEGGFHPSGEI